MTPARQHYEQMAAEAVAAEYIAQAGAPIKRFSISSKGSNSMQEADFQRLKQMVVDYTESTVLAMVEEAVEEIEYERNPPGPDEMDLARDEAIARMERT